ncbi:conserved hypothetical protein [delta proteobacterium NaphS2]|nr:conserved hypothetical protein [delta proteobacterium NaphS2]
MFILNDILKPLQNAFSSTNLGRERAHWFSYAILAFIIPFTSSISSNVLRCLNTLFGLNINKRRFYTFMASNKIPWHNLWAALWHLIPDPLSDGRLMIALDDFINPKTGRNIFGCSHIFDHAAKDNQSKYPWAQNVVLIGLLKVIKGRWACLPLSQRFYLPQKAINAKSDNMRVAGKVVSFQTKLQQAVEMVIQVAQHFAGVDIIIVCDSWFGNNGLFKPLRTKLGNFVHLLSRLRSNTVLYSIPKIGSSKKPSTLILTEPALLMKTEPLGL